MPNDMIEQQPTVVTPPVAAPVAQPTVEEADPVSEIDWAATLDIHNDGVDDDKLLAELSDDDQALPEPKDDTDAPAQQPATPEAPAADSVTPPQEAPAGGVKDEPATPPAAAAAAETTTPPAEDTSLQAQYETWFNRSADLLAEQVYTIDDKDAEAIAMGDAAQVKATLSKMAGRLHMQAMTAAFTQMVNALPQLVPQVVAHAESKKRSEEEFYSEYPELRAHEAVVNQVAFPLAQANPKLSRADLMKRIAAATAMTVGVIPAKLRQEQSPAAPQPQMQPAAPTAALSAASGVPAGQPKTMWDVLVEAPSDD